PARHPCLGHQRTGEQVRREEQGHQQQAVQGHPRPCPHRLRTAEYPASETAASTAASSTVPSAETRSTPVSWLTSTSCTPGTSPTSSRTDISQWPQVMPVTWNWAVVVLMGRLLHRWNISDPIPWRGIGLSLFIPLRGTACKGCRDESGVV